ncbi:uncharacterized protein LOC126893625 [Daktulosphaira vitifoliae]|uniref:uncharacterized protein LOC126893625 n=1 Tax=Daktulosphaira vitifoliae TaxID=58002 RepID=UPI0021AA69B7|nr:uncharacterized protein LOC126893625 [Daktulosphaira vitifoliae]
MRDNFSLFLIVYCFTQCLFANIYAAKINSKNNSLGITQSSQPAAIENNVPDFHVFDWKLCKALYDIENSNAVLSSISVKLVLLMIYEGALGDTAKQIDRIVGFYGDKETIRKKFSKKLQSLQSYDTNDYVLDIGTKLFLDITAKTKKEYNEILSTWYNSSFETVDFSKPLNAVKSINEWANNVTHGHIQELLTEDQTNENTALILLNAIYFQGFWTNPFIKDLTKVGTFNLNSKTTVEVPLMTTYNYFSLSSLPTLNSRMICLPYVGDKFAMYIILPDSADGLSDLVSKINPNILTNAIKSMKSVNAKVVLPKFTFAYTSILGPVLQKLGITDMFGSKANLTNIGTGRLGSLIVSNVIQKAGLDINEQGSTAYAATEVELDTRFGSSVEAEFQVTKPFLFMIYDTKADTVVFVGQVVNPLSKGSPIVTIPIAKPTSENVNLKFGAEPNNADLHRFNYFDSELFQEISSDELMGNFVISSISVKSILLLLSEGAQGDSLKELNNVLRLPKEQSALHNLLQRNQLSMMSSYLDILSVNKIFVKNKKVLHVYFNDIATDLYKADIVEINPSAVDDSIHFINDQIANATKGLINSVITKDDFNGDTELLFANILYFKGDWLYQFNESATDNQCFYTSLNLCTECSMMKLQNNIRYSEISDIGAQAIELPFKDENFTMFLLLPDENNNLLQLTKDLQHNPLTRILTMLHSRVVHLQLPRFTVNYYSKLSSTLKKMGLTTLFEKKANLTAILNSEKPVFVTDIIHKAVIEINEKGARAAAATVASAVPLSSKPHLPPVAVNFNRPFMFFIVNRSTRNILFSGQVNSIISDVSKRFQDIPLIQEKKNQSLPIKNNLPFQPISSVKYQQPYSKNNQSINYKN